MVLTFYNLGVFLDDNIFNHSHNHRTTTRRTEHGQTSRVVWNMSLEWRSRSLDFVLESPDIVPLDSFIALAGGHDDYDLKDEDDCDEMRCSWSTLTDESCHL